VSRTLGTLTPGAAVTITIDVTIDSPFPANTSSVTNQGSVTGVGFGPVLTDDPATGLANDPTITTVTVSPQITCPADIIKTGISACSLPSIGFAATVNAGVPAPILTYELGKNSFTSPYTFPPGTNIVTVTAANGTAPDAVCSFQVTVLPTAPQLSIIPAGTKVVLSWSGPYDCYNLQFTASLLPGGPVWTTIPGPYPSHGGVFFVTNSLTGSNQFFRLKY